MGKTVAGILLRNGRFLVEKRLHTDTDPGYIAIPGGHVEGDESLEDALRREMKEELGIEVQEMKPICIGEHTSTDGEIQRIHYLHVVEWKGRARSREAERVCWESNIDALSAISDRTAIRNLLRSQR